MDTRGLSVGLIVESPNAPQWGPGKILSIGTLAPSSQADPFPKRASGSKKNKPKITKPPFTVIESIAAFLRIFPLGFKDPNYIGVQQSGERQYKWDAHLQWNKSLSGAEGKLLLAPTISKNWSDEHKLLRRT